MKKFVLWFGVVAVIFAALAMAVPALPQNPQTQTAPLFATNAKYTNGTAPGYWPTQQAVGARPVATGLNINVGPGTANCGSGTIIQYAGGTFALTASATNRIYLDTASSCAPAVKTSAFASTDIPIAVVVTSGSAITSIVDDRTPFGVPAAPSSSLIVQTNGVNNSNQSIFNIIGGAIVPRNISGGNVLLGAAGSVLNPNCFAGIGGLVGAFTDGSGNVIQPICIGNGTLGLIVPNGATSLQLGINDDQYTDNVGSFLISTAVNAGSPVNSTVLGTTMPWNPSTNPTYSFGINDGTSAVIARSGLTAGNTITIQYVSGTVAINGSSSAFDANGNLAFMTGGFNNGITGTFFPTKYMGAANLIVTVPLTISALTYTATDTTIVAAWTTSSAADSNLFCAGKPAIDNGFQQGLTAGHLAIVTGLNPSSPYSCYVVSAGTSSSVSTTSTSSPTTRIAIRTGNLGSVSSWTTTGQGDNPYNVVSSDGNTYAVLDDTTVNSLNAAQAIVKFTNETNMTASTINAMTAFGAQAVFNGTDGPGRTGMSNKLWGLWSQSGILCAWEGRLSSGFPQSSWYPWLMCDHGDHGATWNTWQAPTTYTSTGTEIQGAGMFPFGAIGTVSFVNYAADDGTVGYTTSGNGIDGANGWVYMNFNDGWWNGGNYLYMMRVPRVYLNSQASYTRYQFWKGPANPTPADFTSDGNWTSSFVDKVPILSGFGTVGTVNEVYVPGFNYYLLNVSAAGGPYFNPGLPSGNVFTTYSAPTPAGPFTQIYTHIWGTSNAYYDQTFMMRPIQTNLSTSSLAVPLMFADQNADNLHYATFTMNSQVGLSLASFCGGGTAGTASTSISIATNSTCSGSMNVATGNSLLVGVLADTYPNNSSVATRVFDTAGNTFIPISVSLPGPGAGGGGALTQQSIWYLCNNCNGNASDVITAIAQYAGTTPYSAIGVWQIAGGPVAGDGNVKVAFTASGTSIATSSFNTTFTNELCAAIGSKNGTSTVGTAGVGFSLSSASIWGAQYTGEHAIFTSTQTGLAPSMSWTSGQLSIWEACVGH